MKKLILGLLIICITASLCFAGEYKRKYFKHWLDVDNDCQNSRAETLIRYNYGITKFRTAEGCIVDAGTWICPYTGEIFFSAKKLDVDHVIPLKWAWEHGADKWTDEKRAEFANDPDNLLAVKYKSNRSKGAKGLEEWLPSNELFVLPYIEKWNFVKKKYGLE